MLDTVQHRFNFLEPFITAYGPEDDKPRPAVLLFHACNGVREHIHGYAQAAAALGYRAFVVDSFTPRGWDQTAAISLVCSGFALHGYERAGDVLAAITGIAARPDVDGSQMVLAGWSHGGWSIMDLMTQKLGRAGDVRLQDPQAGPLRGVRGLFLVYPYTNYPALSNYQSWEYAPKTEILLARQDFLTPHAHAESVLRHLKDEGLPVTYRTLEVSHCFDEDGLHFHPMMIYDRTAHTTATRAFEAFLGDVFGGD